MISTDALKEAFILQSSELADATSGMIQFMKSAIDKASIRELYFIVTMQLRAFYTLYNIELQKQGVNTGHFDNRSDELFFLFRKYLSEDFRKSRSVSHYADRLNITTRYLSDIVRSHYGKSPKEAINIYTIMQLRLELLQTDKTITEITWQYHFSSPAFFSDYFRRYSGCTPQEYRASQK